MYCVISWIQVFFIGIGISNVGLYVFWNLDKSIYSNFRIGGKHLPSKTCMYGHNYMIKTQIMVSFKLDSSCCQGVKNVRGGN
jgi:hypothetical protein